MALQRMNLDMGYGAWELSKYRKGEKEEKLSFIVGKKNRKVCHFQFRCTLLLIVFNLCPAEFFCSIHFIWEILTKVANVHADLLAEHMCSKYNAVWTLS